MSTLVEIESAVSELPPTQQRSLLLWLQTLVESKTATTPSPPPRRDAWLQRLAERRQRGVTTTSGTPIQQIMDDLRGD